jgi:outer membrane protein OmpA-like peptidoglycan-associated protein
MARLPMLAPLILALWAACAGNALAQEVRQYRSGDRVDPREVAAILGQPSAPAIKMRSIRLLDDSAASAIEPPLQLATAPQAAAAEAPARLRPSALSLPVQFAFDSAEILPPAKQQLDALAEGIRMLPALQSVVIEGHTDAAGTDFYNAQLSQRRALAVKRYLVALHGIEPARLRAVGLGEQAPLRGLDPYAGENRRVQFRGE